ncbi:MAG: TolC family protein [Longimicrobiales bacterium]
MSHRFLCALVLLGGCPALTQAQATDTLVISLAEAERRALEGSPLLSPAIADIGLAEAQRDRARHARLLPEVNLRNLWGPIPTQRGEYTPTGVLTSPDSIAPLLSNLSWFTQVDLTVLQPLYTFGKISSRMDAADHQIELSQAALQKTRGDVILLARQLYWNVVLTDELDGVVGGVLNRVTEAEELLQERYDDGSATQNDLFKFRLFKYQVGQRARQLDAEAQKARGGLRALLRLGDRVPFRVETEDLEPLDVALDSLETYLQLAAANRPELDQLRAGIAARRSLVRAAESDGKPTFYVGADIKFNEAPARIDPDNPFWRNDNNYFRPGVAFGIDWNLNFREHKTRTEIERLETMKLEAQVEPLVAQVEQEVLEVYLDAVRARADVEDGRGALQASENWLRAEFQTFDIGISGIEDVIAAFQANIEMTTAQLQNIARLNTLIAELSQRIGQDIQ